MPAISILLPLRNAARTLHACLRSIRAQTFPDYEILAVDDGSTDTTWRQLEHAREREPRLRTLRNPGRGLVDALNHGLAECHAPLVARMDGDDLMHPERLALQIHALTERADLILVGTQVEAFPRRQIAAGYRAYLDWQNCCISPREIADNLYVESPLAHPSVMFRRDRILDLGGYREGPFPEDYDLWLRVHAAGGLMAKVPRVLLAWRDSEQRTSRKDPRYQRDAFYRLRTRYLLGDPRFRPHHQRFAIWGAGRRTRQRIAPLIDALGQPLAWIDIDPRKLGNRIAGVPVLPPTSLPTLGRPFVLSCVTNHGARAEIRASLEQLGYQPGTGFLAFG